MSLETPPSGMHDSGVFDDAGFRQRKLPECNIAQSISLELVGIEADQTAFSTGIREELVLLSWLAVLLRSREGSSVDFQWAYRHDNAPEDRPAIRHVSMDKVLKGLHSSVQDTAAAILESLTANDPSLHETLSGHAKLVLSTSSLLQTSTETEDEVSQSLPWSIFPLT